jgi:hypothetical protein
MDILKAIIENIEERTSICISCKDRSYETTSLRNIYYRIARDNTVLSLNKIGSMVNRDHATVINGLKKFEYITKHNESYLKIYKQVLQNTTDFFKPTPEILDKNTTDSLKMEVKRLNQTVYRLRHEKKVMESQFVDRMTRKDSGYLALIPEKEMPNFINYKVIPHLKMLGIKTEL